MARILIVDDEPDIFNSLRMLLEPGGHDVTTTEDGEEAKRIIESGESYDLMIFDVRMQPINGMALLEAARSQQPSAKVIMLTAYADDATHMEALKLGALAYLSKPFSAFDVLTTVDTVLAL